MKTLISLWVGVLMLSGMAVRAQTVPGVDWGGWYGVTTLNQGLGGAETNIGQYTFNNTTLDAAYKIPFGSVYTPSSNTNYITPFGKTKLLYTGAQVVNDSTTSSFPAAGFYRLYYYVNGASTSSVLQKTSPAMTANASMSVAYFVKKADFINGLEWSTSVGFSDVSTGAVMNVCVMGSNVATLGFLAQDGTNWYATVGKSPSENSYSNVVSNLYRASRYAFNPSSNMFLNTNGLGSAKSGSELRDIQSFGIYCQHMGFNGTVANTVKLDVKNFSAILVPSAVNFGGEYSSANINSDTNGIFSNSSGDFDFDGGVNDDNAGIIAFGSVFTPPNHVNWTNITGKSNGQIYYGISIAAINSTTNLTVAFNRLAGTSTNSPDVIQLGLTKTNVATMRQASAIYWTSQDFLNGMAQSGIRELNMTLPTQSGVAGKARFLIQAGGKWYISSNYVLGVSGATLSLNGSTNHWYEFDPASNKLFLNEPSLGTAVYGSTLTNVSAIGVYNQTASFAGASGSMHGLTSFGANVAPMSYSDCTNWQAVLDGTYSRQTAGIGNIVTNYTFKTNDTPWVYEKIALGAYHRGNNALGDSILINLATSGVWEVALATNNIQTHLFLLVRDYFLFATNRSGRTFNTNFCGRMSTNAENAVLGMLWKLATNNTHVLQTSTNDLWSLWGSENHHTMMFFGLWGAAQIFKGHPEYSARTYPRCGTSVTNMVLAFDTYLSEWLKSRIKTGGFMEISTPYNKYSLTGIYNAVDFAESAELRLLANDFLELFWADWALEQIAGTRGGSRNRMYTNEVAELSGAEGNSWYHFNKDGGGYIENTQPTALPAATTSWRPSLATVGLVYDVTNRGCFESVSRRSGWAAFPASFPPVPNNGHYYTAIDANGGHSLRYTWVTPDFVMGTMQIDGRSQAACSNWCAGSSQYRVNGLIFQGDNAARIYTRVSPAVVSQNVYNAEWGVQDKGVQILQALPEPQCQGGGVQRIYFGQPLTGKVAKVAVGGWHFVEASNAYAAVKIVSGGSAWEDAIEDEGGGWWLKLNNTNSAIIIEAGRKTNWSSYEAFKTDITNNTLTSYTNRIEYSSSFYGTTLTLYTNYSEIPKVNGVSLNFFPANVYKNPYMQGKFGSTNFYIRYRGCGYGIELGP